MSKAVVARKAEAAFAAYDANHDGLVSKREMARLSKSRLKREQIDRCFEKYDADKDGFLNKRELADMMFKAAGEKNNNNGK